MRPPIWKFSNGLEDYLGGRYAEAALAAGEHDRDIAGSANGESRLRKFVEPIGPRTEKLNGWIDREFATLAKERSEPDQQSLKAAKDRMKNWLLSISKLRHKKRIEIDQFP